jgi:hypothetical protein
MNSIGFKGPYIKHNINVESKHILYVVAFARYIETTKKLFDDTMFIKYYGKNMISDLLLYGKVSYDIYDFDIGIENFEIDFPSDVKLNIPYHIQDKVKCIYDLTNSLTITFGDLVDDQYENEEINTLILDNNIALNLFVNLENEYLFNIWFIQYCKEAMILIDIIDELNKSNFIEILTQKSNKITNIKHCGDIFIILLCLKIDDSLKLNELNELFWSMIIPKEKISKISLAATNIIDYNLVKM